MSSEMGEPKGTFVIITLGDHAEGIYDGAYFDEEGQDIIDVTKCGIFAAKDIVTENPIAMVSITIQGPVESE